MRKEFNMELPEDILTIKDIFVKNGFKLFVVGGAVRDALLGQEPKDFDLATDATPDDVARMMEGVFTMMPLGEAFGISFVVTPNMEIEIATFREDLGVGRRPDEVKFTTIEGDVKRRDLTINALFFDIDTNEIVDLVGGVEDLENRVIRAVGNAADRFNEDKLRVLRAIRFAARFKSELDEDIVKAIKEDNTPFSGDGKRISNERIRDEFLKGLKTCKVTKQFHDMLRDFGIFENWLFEGLKITDLSDREDRQVRIKDPIVFIALLLSENSPSKVAEVLNRQTFTNDEVKGITFLIKLLKLNTKNAFELKKGQPKSITSSEIFKFATLSRMDDNLIKAFNEFELTVSGKLVIEVMGIPKGPQVGQVIKDMETQNFESKLEWVLENWNHTRPLTDFTNEIKILHDNGFRPIGVSQMLFEDTFIFDTPEEANEAYNTLERTIEGEWIGKVVGWFYGKDAFIKAANDYEKENNCKVLTHWLPDSNKKV
jgi:tRNA nucleotidyltransferase/poly(A) polymerase